MNHLLGEMPLQARSVAQRTREIYCFLGLKVLLECSSQSVNGITPQGSNFFFILSSLIDF